MAGLRTRCFALCAVATLITLLAIGVGGIRAQEVETAQTVLLDTFSIWRMHTALAPPALSTGKTADMDCIWLNFTTPSAPQDWTKPDFDDRSWNRGPVTITCKTALASKICLRGKFTVTDPSAVKNLRLSVNYRGGLIVHLNGKEVHREQIAKGKSLAEGPGGEERTLTDYAIPVKFLKKGTNVIGLEIVRAPYPAGEKLGKKGYVTRTCEALSVLLKASNATGLTPCPRRPQGLQVWNANVLSVDLSVDFANPAEPLRPIRIEAARNGLFSGKVVIGSTQPIRGLKVTPGVLRSQGTTIPASAVHIRYGAHSGQARPWWKWNDPPYLAKSRRLDALSDESLDEYPVAKVVRAHMPSHKRSGPPTVSGAVVPIWITVKVPADAKAGTYTSSVMIEVTGEKTVTVPVELHVADWTLPDTDSFRTLVDMIQSPDTLALEYDVPLWSDKHFDLIAQSFKLIGEAGCRTVYVPLIAHTNLGNEESMVRWIKKGNGYDYDFSVMERYLDVAVKNMGKPQIIVFMVWDIYMISPDGEGGPQRFAYRGKELVERNEKLTQLRTGGPMVTLLDPKTGKTDIGNLPPLFRPEASRPLWKPLFDGLRSRLKKRNLDKAMMLGLCGDVYPSKKEVTLLKELTGNAPWAVHSHTGHPYGKLLYETTPIGCQARIWTVSFSNDKNWAGHKDKGKTSSLHGWKNDHLTTLFDRLWGAASSLPSRWRRLPEECITGTVRGVGRLGADYWNVIKDKRGRRAGRVNFRYPESFVRMLCIRTSMLAPGPNGPAATNNMEAFREGVQECEARTVIERALDDEALKARLGPDLARRCEEYLHARHMMMWLSGRGGATGHNWFLSSGWQKRTARLYSLAGEVAGKTRNR